MILVPTFSLLTSNILAHFAHGISLISQLDSLFTKRGKKRKIAKLASKNNVKVLFYKTYLYHPSYSLFLLSCKLANM